MVVTVEVGLGTHFEGRDSRSMPHMRKGGVKDDSQDIDFCGCVNEFFISRLRNVRGRAELGGGRLRVLFLLCQF